MTKNYLLGAAAIALFATTGVARAADVMPIVVPVTPAVAPVAVGPTVTVQVLASTYLNVNPTNYYVSTGFDAEINVISPSGWGIDVTGGAGVYLPGLSGGYGAWLELYRIIGNAEVGFFVTTPELNPFEIDFGPTFRYETDRLEFRHETEISYLGLGDWDFEFGNELTVHANDRLDIDGYFNFAFGFYGPDLDLGVHAELDVSDRLTVEGWADLDLVGGTDFGFGGMTTLHLGPLSPYVGVEWYTYSGYGVFGGVDLEHQIGTGPFTLIGHVGAGISATNPPSFNASIGIRYNLGDADNLLYGDGS